MRLLRRGSTLHLIRVAALAASLVPLLIADGGAVILHHEGKASGGERYLSRLRPRARWHCGSERPGSEGRFTRSRPRRDGRPRARKQGALEQSAQATREQAQNRLLYAAAVDLSRPGKLGLHHPHPKREP